MPDHLEQVGLPLVGVLPAALMGDTGGPELDDDVSRVAVLRDPARSAELPGEAVVGEEREVVAHLPGTLADPLRDGGGRGGVARGRTLVQREVDLAHPLTQGLGVPDLVPDLAGQVGGGCGGR